MIAFMDRLFQNLGPPQPQYSKLLIVCCDKLRVYGLLFMISYQLCASMLVIDERRYVAPEVLETFTKREIHFYELSVMNEYRKVDWVVMQYMMILMIDFIATWFTPYSKFLAGENRKVSYFFEDILLALYSN